MKVWICAVAKMEELYIREWIKYNKKLGVDHIIIGDNNDDDYKHPLQPIIQDYINEGFVELVDQNSVVNFKCIDFYNKIYNERKNEFDWIGFIDIDEFVELPKFDNNIKKFLKSPQLDNFDAVILPWLCYGDSGHLKYEDKPVRERFTKRALNNDIYTKYFIKSSLNILEIVSHHDPILNKSYKRYSVKCCDSLFETNFVPIYKDENEFDTVKKFVSIKLKDNYYKTAYISHYITKSAEEFIKFKILRGRSCKKNNLNDSRYNKYFYYRYCNETSETEKLFSLYDNKIKNEINNQKNKYDIKVWICAIAKMEELYIREWIEWHKQIGIDHIVIGDNNDSDYENQLKPVIKDYIDEGFVELINVKNKLNYQNIFYNQVYQTKKDEYDWLCFIDIDEFLEFPKYDNNVKNFLNDEKIKKFDAVILPWLCYGDNGHVKYEDKPVRERFTTPKYLKYTSIKYFIKYDKNIKELCSHHCPESLIYYITPSEHINVCDCTGKTNFYRVKSNFVEYREFTDKLIYKQIVAKPSYYETAYISHYITKSTEEYVKYKIFRGRPMSNLTKLNEYKIRYNEEFYFRYNDVTEKKERYFINNGYKINEFHEEQKIKFENNGK